MNFFVVIYALAGALAVLLFVYSRRIPVGPMGALLLIAGLAVFLIRLTQAGPYPFPKGFDLAFGALGIGGGLVLAWRRSRSAVLDRLLLAATPIILLGAAIAVIHEVGEIVILRTFDEKGGAIETRLAVVEHQGSTWVGAGAGERRRWFRRLVSHHEVEVFRGGAWRCSIARPVRDPTLSHEVFERLESKYLVARVAASLGHHLFLDEGKPPEESAIAIRLDPCP